SEADILPGGEPVELRRRDLAEIVAVDEQLPGERHFPRALRGIFGVVDGVQLLDLSFRVVREDDAHGIEDGHHARRAAVQILPEAMLEQLDLDHTVALGEADAVAEIAKGPGREAAAPR